MTVQERMELLGFMETILPTLSNHALYSIGLSCTALARGDDGDGETPRETFDAVLDILNEPNMRALGTIACALANAQSAAQRSEEDVEADILRRVRRAHQ